LDKWILAKLQNLIKDVTAGMEAYKLAEASRPIVDFVTELSQWYVRRSRDRFKGDDQKDKTQALNTLHLVLITLSKVMAPFTPFMAEKIYKAVGGEMESVHLEDWPESGKVDKKVLEQMNLTRKLVEMNLALRAEKGIKVRQPLAGSLTTANLPVTFFDIIAAEVNVEKVSVVKQIPDNFARKEDGKEEVGLDVVITDELKQKGLLREIVRTINQIRKEQKLTISDRVVVRFNTADENLEFIFEKYKEEIKKSVLAFSVDEGEAEQEIEIEGIKLKIGVIRME